MNKLPIEKRVQIINLLVEGNSMRATSRITGTSINTVTKLLIDVSRAAERFHDLTVKNVNSKRIQMDEIWSFVYAKSHELPKEKEGMGGDVWTWTAIDADSKLMVSWLVGDRSKWSAHSIAKDLRSRVSTDRIQVSTDGYGPYREALDLAFNGFIDHVQVVKQYATDKANGPAARYGSMQLSSVEKTVIMGDPDMKHASTSYAERQNLTMRMSNRRFTRCTNAFSKKMENHWLAIALHFVYYNFVRVHKTLRVTPAMEAGLAKKPMTLEEIVLLSSNS